LQTPATNVCRNVRPAVQHTENDAAARRQSALRKGRSPEVRLGEARALGLERRARVLERRFWRVLAWANQFGGFATNVKAGGSFPRQRLVGEEPMRK
jgi:hypothetical protein